MRSVLIVLVSVITVFSSVALAGGKASFAEFDRQARAGQTLDVVFLGGSLTWGANASDPNQTSYRALMGKYLQEKYPQAHIRNHDAAIGGTGSDLAMFRLERDVLRHTPELVLIEFAVNDGISGDDPDKGASYETLLRTLIQKGIPVEVVVTGVKNVLSPKVPMEKLKRRTQHLKLAQAYGTAVADGPLYIRPMVAAGKVSLKENYCFEGTHPDDSGYRLFFEAVRDGFNAAVKAKVVCRIPAATVFPAKYAWATRQPLRDGSLPKGWRTGKNYRISLWFDGLPSRWQDGVILCDLKDKDKIEPLALAFNGTRVAVFGEADDWGASLKVSIDNGPARTVEFSAKKFGSTKGRLFMWKVLASDLKPGKHTLTISPVFPEGAKKSQLRIESLCSAGPAQ